jgi:hypothetical protein
LPATVPDAPAGSRLYGQAARSFSAVRVMCSGITFTSASTGMKLVSPCQRPHALVEQAPHLGPLGLVQVAGPGQVTVRRDHQVPVRVGVPVHQHVRALAPPHHVLVPLVGPRRAEDAVVRVGAALDVFEPPGRPQRLRHIQRFQWK